MKKIFYLLVLFAVAAAIVFTLGKVYNILSSAEDSEGKKSKIPAVPVEYVMPRKESLRDIRSFTGTLNAWSSFDIAPKVGGRLERLVGQIGNALTPGMQLVQIEDIEYTKQVAQAAADLAVAEAQLKEAVITLELKQKEFDRQQELHDKHIISDAQYDTTKSALQANEVIHAMREAEVQSRKSALDTAQLKLADTKIFSSWEPASPRYVAERFVDEGALVAPNQKLLTIVEIDRLKGIIHVIERDYPQLKIGQTANITTDAYPGEVFQGRIINIAQILQSNTRQAYVELELGNADLRLKPGMFIRAEIEFDLHENVTVVPRNALVKHGEEYGVFLFQKTPEQTDADGISAIAKFVLVQPGIRVDDMVEILSPEITAPVVTLGNHQLVDGMAVFKPTRTVETAAVEQNQ